MQNSELMTECASFLDIYLIDYFSYLIFASLFFLLSVKRIFVSWERRRLELVLTVELNKSLTMLQESLR